MLSRNDRLALLWFLDNAIWQLGDLIRLAHVTEAISDIDRSLLLQKHSALAALHKNIREGVDNAIPSPRIR